MSNLILTNATSLDALIAAATRYRAALVAERVEEADLHGLYNAGFDVFGCDELYDAARETAAPDEDFFGNPIGSLAERRASYAFSSGQPSAGDAPTAYLPQVGASFLSSQKKVA